jgi:hypothetical protein
MAEAPDKISVSREALRADLSDLELRIVDRLSEELEKKADRSIVDQLDKRVDDLVVSRASREHLPAEVLELTKRVGDLERFRTAIPSVAVLSLLVSVAATVLYFASALHA